MMGRRPGVFGWRGLLTVCLWGAACTRPNPDFGQIDEPDKESGAAEGTETGKTRDPAGSTSETGDDSTTVARSTSSTSPGSGGVVSTTSGEESSTTSGIASSTTGGPPGGCADAETVCDQQCVDLENDDLHCGLCFHGCQAELAGSTCISGTCECGKGMQECPGVGCVDTMTDDFACGEDCINCFMMNGMVCLEGECV